MRLAVAFLLLVSSTAKSGAFAYCSIRAHALLDSRNSVMHVFRFRTVRLAVQRLRQQSSRPAPAAGSDEYAKAPFRTR
jgi:hypothetical protein